MGEHEAAQDSGHEPQTGGWHLGCSHLPTTQSPPSEARGPKSHLPTHNCLPGGLWSRVGGPESVLLVPQELVSKLLHLHFEDEKTKVSGDALLLLAELLKVFVVEATVRSIRQAQAEDLPTVDVEQLEKVLPQLLLDF